MAILFSLSKSHHNRNIYYRYIYDITFPAEQEVLLGASTSFQIENVIYDETTKKHHIYLKILW